MQTNCYASYYHQQGDKEEYIPLPHNPLVSAHDLIAKVKTVEQRRDTERHTHDHPVNT